MSQLNLLCRKIQLSSYENIILETVSKYARSELLPRVNDDFRNKGVDSRKLYKEFGNLGFLGPTILNHGCLGLSYKMYGLIAKEIEYVDSGYRSLYSVQSSLVMKPISKYANEIQKKKYIPLLANGDFVGCFGLTEPNSGSDASNMLTTAVKDGNDYILNGAKTWITNSPIADILLIWAKCEDTIKGFIVERDYNGLDTPVINSKMSLNSSLTGSIFMNDVRVPKENVLNIDGMKGPLSCLNDARLGISFGVLGASKYCIEKTIDYAESRKLFGTLLAEKQLFQQKLADMVTEYNLGYLAALKVADMVDSNEVAYPMISLIKRNNCQKSLNICRTSRDVFGGNGITEDYNIFRHLVNLETVNTYEGTYDLHSLILGNYITGFKAF